MRSWRTSSKCAGTTRRRSAPTSGGTQGNSPDEPRRLSRPSPRSERSCSRRITKTWCRRSNHSGPRTSSSARRWRADPTWWARSSRRSWRGSRMRWNRRPLNWPGPLSARSARRRSRCSPTGRRSRRRPSRRCTAARSTVSRWRSRCRGPGSPPGSPPTPPSYARRRGCWKSRRAAA